MPSPASSCKSFPLLSLLLSHFVFLATSLLAWTFCIAIFLPRMLLPPIFHMWHPLITNAHSAQTSPPQIFLILSSELKLSPSHTHIPYCSLSTPLPGFIFLLKMIIIWNNLNNYLIACLLLTSTRTCYLASKDSVRLAIQNCFWCMCFDP